MADPWLASLWNQGALDLHWDVHVSSLTEVQSTTMLVSSRISPQKYALLLPGGEFFFNFKSGSNFCFPEQLK